MSVWQSYMIKAAHIYVEQVGHLILKPYTPSCQRNQKSSELFGVVIPTNISLSVFVQVAPENNDIDEDGKSTTHGTTIVQKAKSGLICRPLREMTEQADNVRPLGNPMYVVISSNTKLCKESSTMIG